jgi:hypothetical protein
MQVHTSGWDIFQFNGNQDGQVLCYELVRVESQDVVMGNGW